MTSDDVLRIAFPQFFPAHWLDRSDIAFTGFPSCVRVGYVVREAGGYAYLMKDELAEMGLPVRTLHEVALENLSRLPSADITIGRVPGGAEGWISAADNFAAVRILLPSVRQTFREALGTEFCFVLPHRDACFCWSMTQPAERQSRHAAEAVEDFMQDDYCLTPDILLCSTNCFHVHREQPV
jgi:uncharacterized protein YtpQ (UPF0354 family)